MSLLFSDLKFLSKALAFRLKEVLGLVVYVDQTNCVPSSSILDNIYLIRDILDISRSLGFKSLMFSGNSVKNAFSTAIFLR